jgi:hypothetical protein
VAIASILGISVGVYKDAFSESKYPFEGKWDLIVYDSNFSKELVNRKIALVYSRQSENYRGYSDYDPKAEKGSAMWASVDDLSVSEGTVTVTWFTTDGQKQNQVWEIDRERKGTKLASKYGPVKFFLSRPIN